MAESADVLAPDARLRTPRRPLPPGTVDCHAHIFDRFERYPLSGARKYSPPLCTREAWLALHASLGIARGVQVHGSPYGFDNSITEDFLREHPGRFLGVAVVAPEIRAIRRLLAERDDCWTKISSFYRLSDAGPPRYDDMRPIAQTLLAERPERCVWGTNWPHPGISRDMPNDADLLDLLESWLPDDAVRAPLFAHNAARLYRFEN